MMDPTLLNDQTEHGKRKLMKVCSLQVLRSNYEVLKESLCSKGNKKFFLALSYGLLRRLRMAQQQGPHVWDLPDVLLFHVLTYLAPPTHRAGSICQIALLCKAAQDELLKKEERQIWEILLQQDYGSAKAEDRARRIPKRLRRSAIYRVQDAHRLMQDNTEIVFYYLSELSNGATAEKKLSKSRLRRLIHDFGPTLRINRTVSSGGLYLVEVCRARKVKEGTILACVQTLVEEFGALVNISSDESQHSRQTALCVAAVRAMPSVVKYLLSKGASNELRSSGRFRLHTQPRKSVGADGVTPLEFCQLMLDAEREAGAANEALKDLTKCVTLLEKA
ncbi:hypothetical protein FisN_4Lh412 [Fistulifera solaris]|uniref:Uncharacterized protein n=1 Tax=Fistulifera solaris TaxID=1519565 RepID=A0A1Z5KDC0_FISSO|nr:hypothetical protein FisN_4Lh412 [Fistulifera solaris]|eukprot:GAX24300.1 hypothetical protein FisN_4Lh412 [Fistulifera solaris]